jgi:hypothetical protein
MRWLAVLRQLESGMGERVDHGDRGDGIAAITVRAIVPGLTENAYENGRKNIWRET